MTGGRDGDVTVVDAGLFEGRQLAGVRAQPLGFRHGVRLHGLGILVDEQDLMPMSRELTGNGSTDVTGSNDDDSHDSPCLG